MGRLFLWGIINTLKFLGITIAYLNKEIPNMEEKLDSNNVPEKKPSLHSPLLQSYPQNSTLNSPPLEGCPQDGVVNNYTLQSNAVILTTINSISIYRNFIENLPYNSELKQYLKAKRKAGILSEVLFWK